MKGTLEIAIKHVSSGKVQRRKYDNVVVTGFKSQMCHMLAGDIGESGEGRHVDRMQFGTGSMAESVSDTELQMPITPIKAVTVAYTGPASADWVVQFEGILDQDEANGFPISEAGLLCEDDTLAARKAFSAFDKTVDYVVAFRWRISA